MKKHKRTIGIVLCILLIFSMFSCGKAVTEPTTDKSNNQLVQTEANAEWSIYIYMVGSDLEDNGLDQLSKTTSILIEEEAKYEEDAYNKLVSNRVKKFTQELSDMGMSLPNVLFNKTKPKEEPKKETDIDAIGYATYSLDMILSCDIPEGVRFVIQTGGAKRWQSPYVNPNRSQRFLIDSDGLTELTNESVVNMANPDTLEEFMIYCKEYFPAKHEMMLFWDHGNAYGGFGIDQIYGTDMLTIREITNTMQHVKDLFTPGGKPFDIIGFDACLMAELEVARLFRDYGDYYLASAEELSGLGWGYDRILEAFNENPGIAPIELSKVIASANVANVQMEDFWGVFPTTFSVIDLNKIEPVYDAYSKLAKKALILSLNDVNTLTEMSTVANHTLAYAFGNNGGFNLIDLGCFMDGLSSLFPDEAALVSKALDDCVLYMDATTYFTGSSGMSVYYPARMTGLASLRKYLMYTYDLSDNPDIDALYRYKIAGCLNEQLLEYVQKQGYGKGDCLDFTPMQYISSTDLSLDGKCNFSITLPEGASPLTQEALFGLIYVDDYTGEVVYFSEMKKAVAEGDTVTSNFDLTWPSLEGNELPAVVIGESDNVINYRVPIDYYEMRCYMLFTLDKASGKYSIEGFTLDMDNGTGDADRTVITFDEGDEFSVVYKDGNLNSEQENEAFVDFVYSSNMEIEDKILSDGRYFEYLRFDDLRSDIYYSPIVSFTVENGKVTDQYIDWSINAYDTNEKQ